MTCAICGGAFSSNVRCKNGHFVCDDCHSGSANEFIENLCVRSEETDPLTLASQLFDLRNVHMHGPEHHYIVPAVLISVYANLTAADSSQKAAWLAQAKQRSSHVPGGVCGQWGACGAGIGVGLFFSVITGTTPLSEQSWQQANRSTATAIQAIAENGGPRCCKRDTIIALKVASQLIESELGLSVPITPDFTCRWNGNNKECIRIKCPYFNKDRHSMRTG